MAKVKAQLLVRHICGTWLVIPFSALKRETRFFECKEQSFAIFTATIIPGHPILAHCLVAQSDHGEVICNPISGQVLTPTQAKPLRTRYSIGTSVPSKFFDNIPTALDVLSGLESPPPSTTILNSLARPETSHRAPPIQTPEVKPNRDNQADGPFASGCFRWNRTIISEIPIKQWTLLKCLWGRETVPYSEAASAAGYDLTDRNTRRNFRKLMTALGEKFAEHQIKLDIVFTTHGGDAVKLEKPGSTSTA